MRPPFVELGFEFAAMGSPCALRLAGTDEAALHAAADAAIASVREREARWSRFRDDSIVSRVNAAAGGAAVELDAETADLVDLGARLWQASGGRFDLTSGVLRRAWDFRSGRMPQAGEVEALRPLLGWAQAEWRRPRLRLPRAGMQIDLGGLGKEQAADRAVAVLRAHGVVHGWVNLGGDIALAGPRPDGTPWTFAIADPRRPGAVIASIAIAAGALATSGDGERFIDADGRRFGHLLDARSGWPVGGGWQSVSVVAPTCLAAGAVCTVALLHGAQADDVLCAQGLWWVGLDASGRRRGAGADTAGPGPAVTTADI